MSWKNKTYGSPDSISSCSPHPEWLWKGGSICTVCSQCAWRTQWFAPLNSSYATVDKLWWNWNAWLFGPLDGYTKAILSCEWRQTSCWKRSLSNFFTHCVHSASSDRLNLYDRCTFYRVKYWVSRQSCSSRTHFSRAACLLTFKVLCASFCYYIPPYFLKWKQGMKYNLVLVIGSYRKYFGHVIRPVLSAALSKTSFSWKYAELVWSKLDPRKEKRLHLYHEYMLLCECNTWLCL